MLKKTITMNLNALSSTAIVLLLSLLLSPFTSFSQKVHIGKDASNIYASAAVVRESTFSDLPSYIAFKSGNEPDVDAVFLWIKKNMQLSDLIDFVAIRTETDRLGITHYRFQETFAGKPIDGAIWILHTKNDKVSSMNGLLYSDLINSGGVIINEQQALALALKKVNATQYKWEMPGEEDHLKWESDDETAPEQEA